MRAPRYSPCKYQMLRTNADKTGAISWLTVFFSSLAPPRGRDVLLQSREMRWC